VVFASVAAAVREALGEVARTAATSASRESRPSAGPSVAAERPLDVQAVSLLAAATPQAPAREAPAGLFPAGPPTVLGQHRNTYIVASDGEDLLLVDQHTAHERVRFERLVARLEAREAESQLLLAPVVAAFEPRLLPVIEAHAETLRDLGYDVEPFGGGSVRLRAVPPLLAGRDAAASLQALLRDLLEREAAQWLVADARGRVAATLACHSAVRAGQPLPADTMSAIVRDLSESAHPTLCPHGRPTIAQIPRGDVSRWFGRSGWGRA